MKPLLAALAALAAAAVLLAGCGGKQAAADKPLIGVLQIASTPALDASREGYLKALAEGGFEDGKTARIVKKDAQGDPSTMLLIAREFVDQRPALLAPISTPALQAAIKATPDLPIVFSTVADPFITGAAKSESDHLPNLTGAYSRIDIEALLDLARECMPRGKVVGGLFDPSEAFSEPFIAALKAGAPKRGLTFVGIPISSTGEVTSGVQALKARGVEAILQVPGNTVYAGMPAEIQQSRNLGLPLFTVDLSPLHEGSTAAVGLDMVDYGYEAGKLAVRVLKGEKPASIPLHRIDKQTTAVNLAAAQAVGLTFPKSVLDRAKKVETDSP